MSQCIVITSGKGGVGKTTTAANLATGLALAGKTVAVVDADIGLRNLDVILGLENRIVYDLVQVVEGQCRLKQALIRDKRVDGLYMLPAAQTRDKNAVTPDQMRALVAELKELHDYVLIDCPAGIEQGFRNSIAGADRALIVSTPEVSAIRDADRIIGLVEAHELPEPELILNRYRSGMVQRGDMMSRDDILEILAIPLIGIIPGTFAFAILGSGLDSIIMAQKAAYEACVAEKGAAVCSFSLDAGALVTPQLLAAFAALGIVALIPVAVKKWKGRS
jgi:septum site-determining protein MinD